MSILDEDGQRLVKTARLVVTEYLKEGKKIELSKEIKSKFAYKSGVFVTLNKKEKLRGCIGFPMPGRMLHQSLLDAAIASSTEDPRFPPVVFEELNEITFEVTVLTPPVEIKVSDTSEYPKMIKVGRDGLIMRWEFGSGLLLPQVSVEYGWNAEEFLSHTCEKAGAPFNYWKQKSAKILKFEGIVFKETKPNGQVKRLEL
ncbi:MAG: TIGR00296 family protein [Candidatus Nitrosotalea sp.]|nr:TIGR00296 family protein [Candidatus Nitrosotalea sp.]